MLNAKAFISITILSYIASIINQINFFTSKFYCLNRFSRCNDTKLQHIRYEMVVSWYEMTNPMVRNSNFMV